MKVLSINVSEPQKVIFNGKELITSIYKKPVSKKVMVTSQGIEGDRQADLSVHGGYDKAVYGYSYNHYKLWGERLNKEFTEFGLVGENLTIDEQPRLPKDVFTVRFPRKLFSSHSRRKH